MNEAPLTDDERGILSEHGYTYCGGGVGENGAPPYFKFRKGNGGKIERHTRTEWREIIAAFTAPTEDEIAFGKDSWVYCNQHMRAHQTGWCSVSPRDKVGLGVKTAQEALDKCRAWKFPLYADIYKEMEL